MKNLFLFIALYFIFSVSSFAAVQKTAYMPNNVSGSSISIDKKRKRQIKKTNKIENKLKRLVKHNKPDIAKKPESFWTTVVLGLSFAALMLFLNVPIAMLFFFVVTGIGLGGYYIFRKKNKKIAEAFLTIATALNLGLGVVAVYGIWLGSVVD
ncbi:MAG TPA: hypothetical protein ENJ95_19770 [Bacteroidetes bacterium]|nr:hypothetical protein [Bacteroidota bacterium]